MLTSHIYRLQTKPAIRLAGWGRILAEIAIPAELIILITLHFCAVYGKIPVGESFCVTFSNENLKKGDAL
jgi:hypothetical protein